MHRIGFARKARVVSAAVGLAVLVLCLTGCLLDTGSPGAGDGFGANPITAESLEGLILEGEGPIPARLIYRSRNTISSEEDRVVLEAIAQELDRLVELAGQLDRAISGESASTGQQLP